jgi:hypothetical protein
VKKEEGNHGSVSYGIKFLPSSYPGVGIVIYYTELIFLMVPTFVILVFFIVGLVIKQHVDNMSRVSNRSAFANIRFSYLHVEHL